ncbi:PAS domain-containing protein [Myxococcus sp. K38C18041901]|uniref:GAF domain-containing protein n=1 Tax=Myxococcus guangdongensis TaxID=2906760 RepID=UPI0020A78813|nr:PAS domain-containing protein [Myxococcus guangdongensis]MCP3058873.1 PAS domain-containing protein [Myxococcus guangdongensis]
MSPHPPSPEAPVPTVDLTPGALSLQVLESLPQLVWMTRPDGHHVYFNRRWYEYTGLTPEQAMGDGWLRIVHPEDAQEAGRRWAHSLKTGEPYEVEFRCRRHDGVWRWMLGRASPLRDAKGDVLQWFGTTTDIEEPKRASESMRFLAEAGALLSSSALDLDDTLALLAKLAVPQLADWCAVELVEEDGGTRQVAVAHVDPSRVRLAEEVRVRFPPREDDPNGVLAVIRTGRPVLLESVSDDVLTLAARDAEHLRFLEALGLRSAMLIPLKARGRILGALTLVTAESSRRFGRADLELGEQLASRAALSVDTARLYRESQVSLRRSQEERRTAQTLLRIGETLSSELDPGVLVQRITDETVALTGAGFGAFFENRVDERGESYLLYTLSGAPREAFAHLPMPRNTAIFGPTFRGEGSRRYDDVTRQADYGKSAPYHGMPQDHLPVRSYLAVPVKSRSGEILGGLFFGHSEPGRFREEHARLVEGVASQAAVALDNARLFRDARRAEERFRSLVTATAQAVWVTRPDGLIEEDSPSWREYTGQSYDEWKGTGWLDAVHPEDREASHRAWTAAVTDVKPYEVEYRLRRPDGTYSPTLARAVPVLHSDGKLREWIGTNTDMTAQRRVEEGLRRLDREQVARRLEALRAEMSGALAKEGSVADILQGCAQALVRHLDAEVARLWLYSRSSAMLELVGNAGVSAPPREKWARVAVHGTSLVAEVARTREQVWVDKMEHDARVLDPTWIRETGLRSFAGIPLVVRGQLVGVMGLYSKTVLGGDKVAALAAVADALAQGLERRRAEDSLRLRAKELARSNEELQQFAYVASHDLQEPLRMVAGYTQLLARRYQGKLDAEADTFIHYAVDGVTRMQRLIQDLLTYSRVGTQGREPRAVDAARAVERARTNLQVALRESGATLDVGPLPTVLADETQLVQLFQNLIGNALKFHGAAPPRVEVAAEVKGPEARFTVRDWGIGIDAQDSERIFVIFQRLHGKEAFAGTGIGLAICKKIVERLGGRIGVESKVGEGSTFWFTLPLAPSVPAPSEVSS